MNTFNDFFHALTDVMAGDGAIFLGTGMQLFRLILVLLLMVFGAKTMFLGYFHMREFLALLPRILLLLCALTWYRTPSPWGVSLTGMVTDEAALLSNTLTRGSEAETVAFQTARAIQETVDSAMPIIPNMIQLVRWVLVTLSLSFLEGVIWAVISFGFVGVAILIVVGPLFLPWGIFPGLEGLASSWFMAFLAMNFWQVLGSCYMLVAARVLSYFLLGHPSPYTAASSWSLFVPLVMMGCSLTIGTLMIPALAVTLFNAGLQHTAVPRFLRWG
jgi:hypothetical protein